VDDSRRRDSGLSGPTKEVERLASSWDGSSRTTHRSRDKPRNSLLFAQFPLGPDLRPHGPKPTFELKIACIGCWMSRFEKITHAFDKAMLTKIWPCYATSVSICCERRNRLASASMLGGSKPDGTTLIFSSFWMGLIRCDCPDRLAFLLVFCWLLC
jgi:hypothetical protein